MRSNSKSACYSNVGGRHLDRNYAVLTVSLYLPAVGWMGSADGSVRVLNPTSCA
jgi:hypothetical protein